MFLKKQKKICKYILITVIISFLTVSTAYAFGESDKPFSGFYFFNQVALEENTPDSTVFLIFCDAKVADSFQGQYIFSLCSKIEISGVFDGDVILLLSKINSQSGLYSSLDLKYILLPLNILFGLLFISLFKGFTEQAAIGFGKNIFHALQYGGVLFVMLWALAAVFAIVPIGVVVSIVALLGLMLASYIGQISLSIYVGCIILKVGKLHYDSYVCFLVGAVILETLKLLPYISVYMNIIIIPVLSTGILCKVFLDKRIFKTYYEESLESKPKSFEQDKIKSIILKDIK